MASDDEDLKIISKHFRYDGDCSSIADIQTPDLRLFEIEIDKIFIDEQLFYSSYIKEIDGPNKNGPPVKLFFHQPSFGYLS